MHVLVPEVIENMSDAFKPEKYRDEYRERVHAMLDEKSKGREITVAVPDAPPDGQIIDLMQALKGSIEKVRPEQKVIPVRLKRKRLRPIRNTLWSDRRGDFQSPLGRP